MTNAYVTTTQGLDELSRGQFPGNWTEVYAKSTQPLPYVINLLSGRLSLSPWAVTTSTAPIVIEAWELTSYREVATSGVVRRKPLLVTDLGWSTEEAMETRMRLRSFEADWDAPGMEAYDAL